MNEKMESDSQQEKDVESKLLQDEKETGKLNTWDDENNVFSFATPFRILI